MLRLIDTHAHLDMKGYKGKVEDVLARALEAGVDRIINIASSAESNKKVLKLVNTHSMIYGALGIHPHDAKTVNGKIMDLIQKEAASNDKIVAIGEVGLDYHYNHSEPLIQKSVLREFVRIAKSLQLPIIIHDRKAHDDTYNILKEERAEKVGGVYHCFSGDYEYAKKVMDLGFNISVTGIVTFKTAKTMQDVIKRVPLDRIMIETDSPYLSPEPFRGKRNEPAFVKYVAMKIAELRGEDYDTIVKATTENAEKLFKLK